MKNLARFSALLLVVLLAGCGGGGGNQTSGTANDAPVVADNSCTLDVSAWDASDWAN